MEDKKSNILGGGIMTDGITREVWNTFDNVLNNADNQAIIERIIQTILVDDAYILALDLLKEIHKEHVFRAYTDNKYDIGD